jgi:hypothetical protein
MKPGSSMSGSESTCVSACAEKYMASFNVVAQQVVHNMQSKGGIRMTGLGA